MWTKQTPTKAGTYWHRETSKEKAYIVKLKPNFTTGEMETPYDAQCTISADELGGEWCKATPLGTR